MEATLNALRGGRDVLQGMSNAAAGAVSVPVDVLAWALRKAGVPVGDEPVGGSDWMKRKGLTREPENRVAGVIGESIGGVLPMVASAKAPQIAAGVNQMIDNAMAPRRMNPQAGAIVWHGSPHKFTRFDSSKIGTGEGAQAYGQGLYVAESPEVATSYKNLVQRDPNRLTVDGKVVSPDTMYGRAAEDVARIGVKATLQKIDDNIRFNEKYAPDMANMYRDLRTKIEALEPTRVNLKEGNLYKIDLPDEAIGRMLDWDKPLSQQPESVKNINPQSLGLTYKKLKNGNHAFVNSEGQIIGNLQKGGTQESFTKNWTEDVLRGTGSDLYRQLGQGMEGGPKVSSALRQAGIPGIRYLDQGSRAAGQGTSNYVVFPGNEDLLRILEINDQPVQSVIDALRKKK